MTQQEILETIAPVIALHRAAGRTIEIETSPSRIKITAGKGNPFGGDFIRDFAALCSENYIGFAIGAQTDPLQPYILL